MKNIKQILVVLLLAVLTTGCHHSYKHAQLKNKDRLGGERQKVAEVQLEINDHLLLLRNLNTLAMERATFKQTYLVAEELEEHFDEMLTNLSVKAGLNRVTLADELSSYRNDQYYYLYDQGDADFDKMYQNLSESYILDFKNYLVSNVEHPDNESIRELCRMFLEDAIVANAKVKEITI